MLTNNYSTSMKRKLDQLLESESRTQNDNQRFDALFQKHILPSSSGVLPSIEAPNNQPPVLPPSGVTPSCFFILTHAYVHVCNFSEILIDKLYFIQCIVLNTIKHILH